MEYAKQEFKYRTTNKAGVSIRDELESVYRQTGVMPAELSSMVELPESLEYIWFWFYALHSTRQDSFGGECSLTYTEMLSYFTLIDVEPEEWEIKLINQLDITYLNHVRTKRNKETPKPKSKK